MRIQKIKQLFCKHRNKQWYRVIEKEFANISGETRVLACPKCEKVFHKTKYLAEYEGRSFK